MTSDFTVDVTTPSFDVAISNGSASLRPDQARALREAPILAPNSIATPLMDSRQCVNILSATGNWWAGQSTTRPIEDTSLTGSDFNDPVGSEVYPGDAWPFQVPASQQEMDITTPGYVPSHYAATGINNYRSGFKLPGERFVNGAELRIVMAGTLAGTASSRMLEVIVDPEFNIQHEFDRDAASGGTELHKAAAFQSPTLPTSGNRQFCIEIIGNAIGTQAAGTQFEILWRWHMMVGPQDGGSLVIDDRQLYRTYPLTSVIDPRDELMWNVRFKTDTVGNALGATASIPRGSTIATQSLGNSVVKLRSFRVDLFTAPH